MKKTNQVRQVVSPILAALIWGTAFVAQDVVSDKIDAFTFNALRSAVAVAVLQHPVPSISRTTCSAS